MHRIALLLAAVATGVSQVPRTPAGAPPSRLATGQTLRAAGRSVGFPGRPVDLALSQDGRTLYAKDNRAVVSIDLAAFKVAQELRFPEGGGSMHGICVTPQGSVLATTAQDRLWEARRGADGRLAWARSILLPGPGGKGNSHPCGIAVSRDGARAWVCLSRNNSLAEVDLREGRVVRQVLVGVAPFDVVLEPGERRAWVSNWGGRRPRPGERAAPSSGTPVLVDRTGVADSGTVSLVNLDSGGEVVQLPVGLHPCDLELEGSRLYVANANSDSVAVIDAKTRRVVRIVPVHPDPSLGHGSAPTGLALGRGRLYAALGGSNAVAVMQTSPSLRVLGFVPTGWYPGAVRAADGRLLVACVKGTGAQRPPAAAKGRNTHQHWGTVSVIPLPDATALAHHSRQVRAGTRRAFPGTSSRATRRAAPLPVPLRPGDPSVFRHVVYIIKENRTYDQVFGDIKKGAGDPSLCIYGRDVTPNHHALAERFVLLDNFYCNGVLSADGHSWATEANVTDHLEKSFGGFTRSYTWGDDPLTYSRTGFLWDAVLDRGLSFRNFGEMDYAEPVPPSGWAEIYKDYRSGARRIRFRQSIGIERLRRHSVRAYPGWNMSIPDVLRADVFLKELREAEKRGTWPRLTIVFLGTDHTSGTAPGYPTPRAQVADNDLALGRIVEGLSRSRFWKRTCVFVIEDDPQDGFDHLDGHRSLCLVASPYTRRGAVISRFYNQTSVLHTIERILGLPTLTQFDAIAPVMDACFTNRPDFRPYRALANRVPLDEMNPPASALRGAARLRAEASARLNLRRPDAADEDTLNRILWHAARGDSAPYPSHLAGAHGRGLAARGLRLTAER